MHQHFVDDPDMKHLLVDSTVIRAHPCAAGALKKRGGQTAQELGRSRGGFSTKIHVSVDALGNPLRFTLTGGQRHDITQADALIGGYESEFGIADKSYDADGFRQTVIDSGAEPVIPSRSNRKQPYSYDEHLYRERHLVECFIGKIKHYRCIFSRFEKLAKRYLGFLSLVSALIWLR
jgi:transposase